MKYACSKDARLKDQLPVHQGTVMIAILDYGAGNLRSVQNTLAELDCEYTPGQRCRRASAPPPRFSSPAWATSAR